MTSLSFFVKCFPTKLGSFTNDLVPFCEILPHMFLVLQSLQSVHKDIFVPELYRNAKTPPMNWDIIGKVLVILMKFHLLAVLPVGILWEVGVMWELGVFAGKHKICLANQIPILLFVFYVWFIKINASTAKLCI